MKTNLEKYAERMSNTIKSEGAGAYHWSEICMVIDELLRYADFSNPNERNDLCFVGFTNGSQISYVAEEEGGEGVFYCNPDNECYIPLYMLKSHIHRIETTGGDEKSADRVLNK